MDNSADLGAGLAAAAIAKDLAMIENARDPMQRSIIAYFEDRGSMAGSVSPISESKYDELVADHIKKINSRERAMAMLGIVPEMVQETQPLLLGGYDYENSTYVKSGKDGKWRASTFEITWVFCGDEQIYAFSSGFETYSNRCWDIAREYYYKDISNVKHKVGKKEKFRKKKGCFGITQGYSIDVIDYSAFEICDKGGNSFSCVLMKNDAVERSIQGLKAKIREKKFA